MWFVPFFHKNTLSRDSVDHRLFIFHLNVFDITATVENLSLV